VKHEIAVGADPSDVQRQVVRETIADAGRWALLGAILALTTVRVAAGFPFGISPYDGATLLVAAGTLVAAGALGTGEKRSHRPASVLRAR
jgi:hypothetical protein